MSGSRAISWRHPSAAEWKVMCAMTHEAVHSAVRDGWHHVTFQGYRIEARRQRSDAEAGDVIEIWMSVGRHNCSSDCERIEVARYPVLGSACLIQSLQVSRDSTLLN